MKKRLFYDCEIVNPIRQKDDWRDYQYLGISVIGCYASWLPEKIRLQAFTEGNFQEFQKLADEANEVIGFNSLSFDDRLCQAHGIRIKTTYDLMVEVRRAAGEPLSGPCTPGYNLAQLAEINLGQKKTGLGSQVPDLWGQGKYQQVIDYCLNDVMLLMNLYQRRTRIIDPVYPEVVLHCDPNLIDWERWIERSRDLFADAVFSVEINLYWLRWCDADLARLDIKIAGAFFVGIPICFVPKKRFKAYVGIPFDRKSSYQSSEPEIDQIPF